jgi:hypothetical protein
MEKACRYLKTTSMDQKSMFYVPHHPWMQSHTTSHHENQKGGLPIRIRWSGGGGQHTTRLNTCREEAR